ncbi:hypothetical protein BH23PAT2_BH23PAT2_02150 [soil metagenome]
MAIEQGQREMRDWLGRIDSCLSGVESDIKEIYTSINQLQAKGKDNLTKKG